MSSISSVDSSTSSLLDYLDQLQSSQNSTSSTSSQFQSLLTDLDTVSLGGDDLSSQQLSSYNRFKCSSGDREPPSMTAEQLSEMRDRVSDSGGDTSALDQVIENFDVADTDQDGSVSADEFRTYAEENGLEMPEPPEGGHGPGQRMGHDHQPPDMTEDQLASMRDDLAQSGEDTTAIDEVLANFDVADTNEDGTVSADEFRTYAEENGLEMPKPPKPPEYAESDSESDTTNSSIVSLLNKYAANNSYLSDSTISQLLGSLQA